MQIEELYAKDESINIDTYLTKCGVTDVAEYINPNGTYIEHYNRYDDIIHASKEIEFYSKIEDSKIIIVQDGDTDGVCSTVILYQYLKRIKPNWDIIILIHSSKQRGLQDETVMNRIRQEKPDLVIVPDAGTNDIVQAEELCNLEIGLIVLDHHDYTTPIQKGYLINNQNQNYKVQRNGSGALVTHKFLQRLDDEFNVHWSADYIDLVALSLVSDSMIMSEMENREYYHFGIETRDCIHNEFLGKMFDKFIGEKEYTQRDVSFKIVPKINSICRHLNMEYKQRLILALIGQDDYDEVIEIVDQGHKDQIATVDNIIEANISKIQEITDNHLIVFASDDIPRSYSGLVCGKIMNLCNGKPSIVGSVKDGYFIGSLRSPIKLRTELDTNELVEWASGHEESCGICIKEENIQPLVDYYNTIEMSYTPQIQVLKSYTIKSVPTKLFGLFEPYKQLWTNQGLPKPMFHISNIVFSPEDIQIIGKNKRVLKLHSEGIDIVIFNCLKEDKVNFELGYYEDDCFVEKRSKKKLNLECVGELSVNEWNGKKQLQIIIDKYEISEYQSRSKNSLF